MKRVILVATLALFVACASTPNQTIAMGTIDLTWTNPITNVDGSALLDLSGTKIYYGNVQGGPYPNEKDAGINTNYRLILQDGDYCFVASSYDTNGNESDYSNEVCENVEGYMALPISDLKKIVE